jgi:protein subunit release factor B
MYKNTKPERGALLFSLTKEDFEIETFRAGGKGGQNQNKRDTGVRIRHRPSGTAAESREERTQLANKKIAFRRLCEDPVFRAWLTRQARVAEGKAKTREQIEKEVDETVKKDLADGKIIVETFDPKNKFQITENL